MRRSDVASIVVNDNEGSLLPLRLRRVALGSGREGLEVPTTRITKLRFPDGDAEYRTTPADLRVGTVIRSRGRDWVVTSITGGTALLGQVTADGDGEVLETPAADPMVDRGPLGDDPLVLEALEEM